MENCTLIDETEDKAIPITAQYFRRPLKFRHPSKEQATKHQICAGNHASINIHRRMTWTQMHAIPWLLKRKCTYKNTQERCICINWKVKNNCLHKRMSSPSKNLRLTIWLQLSLNLAKVWGYTVSRKNSFCGQMTCLFLNKGLWIITGVHNAYQLKSACSRNQNSKASIKWKLRSRHKIIPANIKGFCEFGFEAVALFHRILCRKKCSIRHSIFQQFCGIEWGLCCIDVRLVGGISAVSPPFTTSIEM